MLYAAGLRRAEAVALNVSDYDRESGELRVAGKGNKERTAYATGGAVEAVTAWLMGRGDAPGPLLCPVDKAGRVAVRRLTPQAVLMACRKRARAAGVQRFSPHDLRRSFIGDLLDAGVDLATVQQLAGHAQVNTTARYDRRPEAIRRKAAELLHVPFRARSDGAVHNRPQ